MIVIDWSSSVYSKFYALVFQLYSNLSIVVVEWISHRSDYTLPFFFQIGSVMVEKVLKCQGTWTYITIIILLSPFWLIRCQWQTRTIAHPTHQAYYRLTHFLMEKELQQAFCMLSQILLRSFHHATK